MSLLAVLLQVVAPTFLVIGVGVLLGRFVKLDLLSLSRAALYAATPALVFDSLSTTELQLGNIVTLAAGELLVLSGMAVLAFVASGRMGRARRRAFIASNVFVNSGNLLLPVSLFAFGQAGLQRALLLYVLATVLIFMFGPLVLSGGGAGERAALRMVLELPVLWAALAGIAFDVSGWRLPLGLSRGIATLGDAAIPSVLLALGIQIQRSGAFRPESSNWYTALLKLLLGPVVAYLVGRLLGARGLDLAILTLFGAMPPAVNNFILALELGGRADEVARTLVLTTLLSLGSIPVVIFLLDFVA